MCKKTCENEIENVLKRMNQEHEFWNILIEINSIQIKKILKLLWNE